MGLIPDFSSLSDETLNRRPITIFQGKLRTRTDCDEAGDYVVPNVLSPRDLIFRPDIGHKLYHHHYSVYQAVGSGTPQSYSSKVMVACLRLSTTLYIAQVRQCSKVGPVLYWKNKGFLFAGIDSAIPGLSYNFSGS